MLHPVLWSLQWQKGHQHPEAADVAAQAIAGTAATATAIIHGFIKRFMFGPFSREPQVARAIRPRRRKRDYGLGCAERKFHTSLPQVVVLKLGTCPLPCIVHSSAAPVAHG